MAMVESLNADPNNTAVFAMNQFGDRTKQEMNALKGHVNIDNDSKEKISFAKSSSGATCS